MDAFWIIIAATLIAKFAIQYITGKGQAATVKKATKPNGEAVADIAKTLPFGEAPAPDVKPGIHTHNRLDTTSNEKHTEAEHWKQQLDGFLKAGLIDREEYKALYEQRKKCYHADTDTAHE